MYLGQKAIRDRLIGEVKQIAQSDKAGADVKAAADAYLATLEDGAKNADASKALADAIEKAGADCALCKDVLAHKEYLSKKSVWIFGGDGWAYDIGFGGVDHVLAQGNNVNIMVFDTEVYSNT